MTDRAKDGRYDAKEKEGFARPCRRALIALVNQRPDGARQIKEVTSAESTYTYNELEFIHIHMMKRRKRRRCESPKRRNLSSRR